MRPFVNMFWHGRLMPLVIACIQSFLDRGIGVKVFSYEEIRLPSGATHEDAATILPRSDHFLFESSSSAFSNIFRYKLLLDYGGWWVDSDVVLLQDHLPECEHYWAREDAGLINGAVLRFPRQDPLCGRLLRESIEIAKSLDRWGQLGPELLTRVLADSGVKNAGTTADTYPVHWLEAHYLWFPDFSDLLSARLRGANFLHLYHSMFSRMGIDLNNSPPDGGYIQRLTGQASDGSAGSLEERLAVRDYLSHEFVPRFEAMLGRAIIAPGLVERPTAFPAQGQG
jgi:hypothetical protein